MSRSLAPERALEERSHGVRARLADALERRHSHDAVGLNTRKRDRQMEMSAVGQRERRRATYVELFAADPTLLENRRACLRTPRHPVRTAAYRVRPRARCRAVPRGGRYSFPPRRTRDAREDHSPGRSRDPGSSPPSPRRTRAASSLASRPRDMARTQLPAPGWRPTTTPARAAAAAGHRGATAPAGRTAFVESPVLRTPFRSDAGARPRYSTTVSSIQPTPSARDALHPS